MGSLDVDMLTTRRFSDSTEYTEFYRGGEIHENTAINVDEESERRRKRGFDLVLLMPHAWADTYIRCTWIIDGYVQIIWEHEVV